MDPRDWVSTSASSDTWPSGFSDLDLTDIDRISTHYDGEAYSNGTGPATAWIDLDRGHGWGRFKNAQRPSGSRRRHPRAVSDR